MSRVFCGRPGAGQNPELDFACLSVSNRKFWRHNFAPPETPARKKKVLTGYSVSSFGPAPARAWKSVVRHLKRLQVITVPHARKGRRYTEPSDNKLSEPGEPSRTRPRGEPSDNKLSEPSEPSRTRPRGNRDNLSQFQDGEPSRARGHKFKLESMRLTDSRKVQKTCTSGYMVAT